MTDRTNVPPSAPAPEARTTTPLTPAYWHVMNGLIVVETYDSFERALEYAARRNQNIGREVFQVEGAYSHATVESLGAELARVRVEAERSAAPRRSEQEAKRAGWMEARRAFSIEGVYQRPDCSIDAPCDDCRASALNRFPDAARASSGSDAAEAHNE